MISAQQVLNQHYPSLSQHPRRYSIVKWFFSKVLFEDEFQAFGEQHPHLKGVAFIDQVFAELNISYRVSQNERERIPSEGRVVIIANHPIGSVDGLALLHLVSQVRKDVKIVANEVLSAIKPLEDLLLPVDNMRGNSQRKQLMAIKDQLDNEGAVIIFPAGEVSRLKGHKIQDGKWSKGFVSIAIKANTPLLPICVKAKNSKLFYFCSFVYRPLSTLLLVKELFFHRDKVFSMVVGEQIPVKSFGLSGLERSTQAQLLKKHLYRIGNNKKGLFQTEAAIAHPEQRLALKKAIKQLEHIGETPDGKQICLCYGNSQPVLLSELGRLRELSFRAVGEGTGRRTDTDKFDANYIHLILWDTEHLEIAGAYRFTDTKRLIEEHGIDALYSQSLFEYDIDSCDFLQSGIELGRSFVQPKYWGKRSLDYLWLGIGAFLARNPQYRYLFGPVSISAAMPEAGRDLLIHFYQTYFPATKRFACSRQPYQLAKQNTCSINMRFTGEDYKTDFAQLKSALATMGTAVPTLYKQYTELCLVGGVQFIDFNVDPEFNQCIDGLVLVDLQQLKEKKKARYIDVHLDDQDSP
ncbi:lysophospholipid acyltransferase family protein [Agarivorans sp. TSD2052]|uniref:lysophospholipid acyltransferase family protein n=1 Tax=Agarivorans sp. TSD2052 TaxID=2937286 RepID=UPI00200E443A|nr:lysophospholipid acyltransferase family protein [Agarivorans sp. TSD2052]UPW17595.1 lysophospholipid acyltransferase family protein [Agarivorans sp. TSD2052]